MFISEIKDAALGVLNTLSGGDPVARGTDPSKTMTIHIHKSRAHQSGNVFNVYNDPSFNSVEGFKNA